MRLLSISSLALAACCGFGTIHAESAPAMSPEEQVQLPIKALRNNDYASLFKLAPADKQAEAHAKWKEAGAQATPDQKAQFNQFLSTMLAPNAVDGLMALAEPQLSQVNPQELVGYVQMFGGMMAMQMSQDPKTAEMGKQMQQLVADVAAWIPTAGIEDPKKLRAALTSVAAGVQALGVKTADEFYALSFDDMLGRVGGAVKEVKEALKVYDLQADKMLDSMKLTDVQGSGDQRTGTLKATAFGHEYSFPVTLIQKDGVWQFKNEQLEQGLEGLAPGMMGGGM